VEVPPGFNAPDLFSQIQALSTIAAHSALLIRFRPGCRRHQYTALRNRRKHDRRKWVRSGIQQPVL